MTDSRKTRATGQARILQPGMSRIGALAGFVELVRELGGMPERVLAYHGLDISIFDNPENNIPMLELERLLEAAVRETGCETFGLMLGERQDPAILGPLFILLMQETRVGAGIRAIQPYFHLHNSGADVSLQVTGDVASLHYSYTYRRIALGSQGLPLAMAVAHNLLRYICGPGYAPIEVHHQTPKPHDTQAYWRYYRCPVLFDQEDTAIYFPASWIDKPIANASPLFGRVLQNYLYDHGIDQRQDWPAQVRKVLVTLLPMGKASIDLVARAYGVSRRTLHRRLAEAGTTFEAILDDLRFETAAAMLMNGDWPMTSIATMSGYADLTAFSRAFKRKTGEAPSHWRRSQRLSPSAI